MSNVDEAIPMSTLRIVIVGLFIFLAAYHCGQKDPVRPKYGSIAVFSSPPKATIVIDDDTTGFVTPDTVIGVSVGRHMVAVFLRGYTSEPASFTVDVEEDEVVVTPDFTMTEIAIYGSIAFFSIPMGASIFLDGEDTGLATPDTVDSITVEQHAVVVRLDGFVIPETMSVTVEENQVHQVDFNLLAERVALAELFTTTWCPNCPEAEAGVDVVSTEFGPSTLVVLEYHGESDPLENPATQARRSWYGVSSYPNIYFDGWENISGAGGDMSEPYRSTVVAHLEEPSPITLSISSFSVMDAVDITANVAATDTVPYNDLRVQFVAFEDSVYYQQGQKYYRFVVRGSSEEDLAVRRPGDAIEIQKTISASWDQSSRVGVVVFVERSNPAEKEVMQAISTRSFQSEGEQ